MPAISDYVTFEQLNNTVSGLAARLEKNLPAMIRKCVQEELDAREKLQHQPTHQSSIK